MTTPNATIRFESSPILTGLRDQIISLEENARAGPQGDLMASGVNSYSSLQVQGRFQDSWGSLTATLNQETFFCPFQNNPQLGVLDLNALCRDVRLGNADRVVFQLTIPVRRASSGTRNVEARTLTLKAAHVADKVAQAVQTTGFRTCATEVTFGIGYQENGADCRDSSEDFFLEVNVTRLEPQPWMSLVGRSLTLLCGGDWPRLQGEAHALQLTSGNEPDHSHND
jgi:hypothetical protein